MKSKQLLYVKKLNSQQKLLFIAPTLQQTELTSQDSTLYRSHKHDAVFPT